MDMGRYAEADARLLETVRQFPDHAGLAAASARAAMAQGQWATAESRWRALTLAQPDRLEGWIGQAEALAMQGAPAQAETILLPLLAQHPDHVSLHATYAEAAAARGDWAAAEQRWHGLMDRFADNLRVVAGQAEAMIVVGRAEAAEAVLETALVQFPDRPRLLALAARCAAARGAWALAEQRWSDVLARTPDQPAGLIGRAEALFQLGQAEAAEALLREPAERFPQRQDLQRAFAAIAARRGDWVTALARYTGLRERFPASGDVWLGCAEAQAALGQPAEAKALLDEAETRFPGHAGIATFQARLAEQRNAWEEALARWQALHERRPGAATALGVARALRMLGRMEAAGAAIDAARRAHPDHAGIAGEYATQAAVSGDWADALLRYRAMLDRFGESADGRAGLVQALLRLNRPGEAEAAARTGLDRFPNNRPLRFAYAASAQQQGHWQVALERWRSAAEVAPREVQVTVGISECERILAGEEPADGAAPAPHPAPVATGSASTPRDIMMCFESLGADCEFGLVQRHYLAEPLSLLRWGFVQIDELITWLDTDFEGIGLEDNTDLIGRDGYYIIRDKRYELTTHTFQPVGSMDHDRFFQQQCRRLRDLRGKLLEDLAAPSKIFLYKAWPSGEATREQVLRLHRAMQRHGPNTLLYLEHEQPDHPQGLVEAVDPGLLWGYIDHFSRDNLHDIAYPSWLSLCTTAYQMNLERIAAAATAAAGPEPVPEKPTPAPAVKPAPKSSKKRRHPRRGR